MQYGPGFWATFLYYFASTAFVFSLVTMQGLGVGMDTGLPQQVGLVGGLISGLIGGYFNRTMTLEVPVKNKKVFLKTVKATLAQLGYQEKQDQTQEAEDDILVYERQGLGKFLSGKVYIQIDKNSATIASRAGQMRKLRKEMVPETKEKKANKKSGSSSS